MRWGRAAAAAAIAATACSAAPRIEPCDQLLALAERVVACDQLAAAPRTRVAAGRKQLEAALAELGAAGGADAVPAAVLADMRASCTQQEAEQRATYRQLAPACFE